jgi:thioredoxin reductase
MARIIIIGDGPGGLSAALFLAKNGHSVSVYAQDQTPMHHAQLHNYLGLPDITGSDFQRDARKHVEAYGATIVDDEATGVDVVGEQATVRSASHAPATADYLVVAGGKGTQRLARELGLDVERARSGTRCRPQPALVRRQARARARA